MSEITICPFRTYTEVRPAILQGQGDFTLMGFMNCLKGKCPAFFAENGEEYCKRLAQPERKTGRWIYDNEAYPGGNPYGHYDCDQCGESVPHKTNFCPNCGARMEVEHT